MASTPAPKVPETPAVEEVKSIEPATADAEPLSPAPAEAKPVEPTTVTTRTPLSQIPHAKIVSCSAVLPNKMQCWRAGDVQVTKINSFPATEDNPSGIKTIQYQVCYFHNSIEEQQEADQLTKPAA